MTAVFGFLRVAWPYLLVAAIAGGGAWTYQSARWDADVSERERAWEQSRREAVEAVMVERNRLASQISEIDAKYTDEMKRKQDENDSLRADLDTSRRILRVRARCPASQTGTPTNPGVGDAGAAQLDREATADYLALRAGIEQVTNQLKACQGILRSERQE